MTFEQRLARIQQIHALDREDGLAVCDGLRAAGDHAQEIRAISGIVTGKLGDMAVHLRHPSLTLELVDCGEFLERCVKRMLEATRVGLASGTLAGSFLFAGEFVAPLRAALLAKVFTEAEELARLEREPWVRDNEVGDGAENADVRDLQARVVAAAVRDDGTEFEKQERRLTRQTESLFLYREYEWIYAQLLRLVLARDGAGFGAALAKADELFHAKSMDRRLKKELETHDDPTFGVDYRAVAIANLAASRGMQVSYSSETLPRIN